MSCWRFRGPAMLFTTKLNIGSEKTPPRGGRPVLSSRLGLCESSRILRFLPPLLRQKKALAALERTVNHPAHQFWPDDVSVVEGLAQFRNQIVGHQQVVDAYLIALAIHHRGRLATLDKRITGLIEKGSLAASHLELIGS
jgi:hypothetical protein